jgi:aquaporin Z
VDTKKLLAELVGTFTFFLIAFMAAVGQTTFASTGDLVVIALGFGLGLLAAIQIFGAVSGGHFNPAVTTAAVLDRRMDPATGVGYVASQLIGGIAAAVVVAVVFGTEAVKSVRTVPHNGVDDIQALLLETIFTAFFVLVILVSTKKAPNLAGIVIALTLVAIHLALVPFTGTSVNPARSIAPAVIGGDLTSLWVFIVGPTIGAIIGWAVYKYATGESSAA